MTTTECVPAGGYKIFLRRAMPWETDATFDGFSWDPDHLSHQEFWLVLAAEYGLLATRSCWERYVAAEQSGLSLGAVFADCGGQTSSALWWAVTAIDADYRMARSLAACDVGMDNLRNGLADTIHGVLACGDVEPARRDRWTAWLSHHEQVSP